MFALVPTCSLFDVTASLDGVVLSRTCGCHVNFVINIPDKPLSGRLLTTKKILSASVVRRGIRISGEGTGITGRVALC